MALFEEYKNHQDESIRKRAYNWAIAIGLQHVDGLNVSDFLIQVARQEIEGKITMDKAQALIDEHYAQNRF
ncbi:MAG: antitoxin VbhA family protein [Paludibacteraceae bacterium]|nr:antitoxin VbhA family protein [Paludibacteraceae bacterium]